MVSTLNNLLTRLHRRSTFNLRGQSVELERSNRLSFKDGLRTHWLTVRSDGTLKGGVFIDISTMNATNMAAIDETRATRVDRACKVRAFLAGKGFSCEIFEDGRPIQDVCNGARND